MKAGNIPLVPGVPHPDILNSFKDGHGPTVIGLKITVERLLQIRSQRLLALNETSQTDYVDADVVRKEVTEANRLFPAEQMESNRRVPPIR